MADYFVGNAPYGASYQPPRIDASWLGNLPQTFYQGAEARRQYNLANAFPQGLEEFRDPTTGQVDYGKMTDRILKIGGPQAMGPMLEKMMLMQMYQGPNPENEPNTPTQGGYPPRNQQGANPAALGARVVPPSVAKPGYDSQGDNIVSLVTERFPGGDNPQLINYIKGLIFPNDPEGETRTLSGDQAKNASDIITAYRQKADQARARTQGSPGPSVASMAPGIGVPPQSGGPPQTGGQATAQPGSSASGAATPPVGPTPPSIGAQPGPGPAPGGPYAQNAGGGTLQPSAGAGVQAGIPPQFSDAARAALDRKLQRYTVEAARREAITPGSSKALETRMNTIKDQIKAIDDFQKQYYLSDPTRAGYVNPAEYEQRKAINAADTKHADDLFNGIQGQADISARMVENLRQQKAFVNSPEFTSGNFNEAELWLKRQFPFIAGEPTSMELYRKTLAENIKTEMSSLRTAAESVGSTATRIFVPEIKQVETMSGGLDNSVTGLRALSEIRLREHERNIQLANFAAAYKTMRMNNLPPEFRAYGPPPVRGMLDTNFEQGLRDWIANHPLFDKDELRDPRIMGAREPPPMANTQAAKDWATRAGVQEDEPLRVPNPKNPRQKIIIYYHGGQRR